MSKVITIARREFGAYFLSPIAYVVCAVFLFTAGLVFGLSVFQPGAEASLRTLLNSWLVLILPVVLSLFTMRLVSDEIRSGTLETLMTVPITEIEIILGKFFGAVMFYVVLLIAMLIYPLILSMYGDVDVKLLICNYIGLLLMGSLFVSIGLFFSTCTRHQLVAAMLTVLVVAFMVFVFQHLAQRTEGSVRVLLQQLWVLAHFQDFVRGLIDFNHVIYFVTTTGFFLFLAVKVLEMRRWR